MVKRPPLVKGEYMSSLALSNATLDTFGVNRTVIARFLFKGEEESFTQTISTPAGPLDLSNFTFTFRLIKQKFSSAKDTKNGYSISNDRIDDPDATEINLDSYVQVTDAANGKFVFAIPELVTGEGENADFLPTILCGFLQIDDNASFGELVYRLPICVVVK